jgi:hypothetical protein
MRNRYGNEYEFIKVADNSYKIEGDLSYWRFGGKEGEQGVNSSDLGFVDPSGGPFISIGYEIEGRKVKRISNEPSVIFFEVE